MTEYRVVQVADVHLGAGKEHHLDNWEKVLDWIARERPDIVVANGDLIMSDPDTETDYVFARAQFDRLTVPCRYLPGNHDIGDNIVAGAMPQRVDDTRRARFLKHFGEERWAFEAAGWGLIGINAQLLGSNGQPAEAEQWQWFEQSLEQFGGKPVALFLHKPLFLDHPLEPDYEDWLRRQSCLDLASRTQLLALCRRYNVKLISSAHKHQTRAFSFDGIYHLWAPATACVNGPPSDLHWGAREVGFLDLRFRSGGRFEHRFVGADFLFRHENYMRKRKAPAQ